jgi:hypothetical protein
MKRVDEGHQAVRLRDISWALAPVQATWHVPAQWRAYAEPGVETSLSGEPSVLVRCIAEPAGRAGEREGAGGPCDGAAVRAPRVHRRVGAPARHGGRWTGTACAAA